MAQRCAFALRSCIDIDKYDGAKVASFTDGVTFKPLCLKRDSIAV